MRLVKSTVEYHEFMRTLRNDERVKQGFIQQGNVTADMQEAYMKTYGEHYFICIDDDGVPMGYVGVIDDDIRVCTHPDHQHKGAALFMIDAIEGIYPEAFAKIKLDNIASQKLFEKAGFKLKYYLYEREKH